MTKATELLKAVVILALGIAMVVAPSIGDESAADATTIPRTLAWAWSQPLGVVFVVVGIIGLYALTVARGSRPSTTPSLP